MTIKNLEPHFLPKGELCESRVMFQYLVPISNWMGIVVVHCLPASVWNKARPDKHRYGGEGAGARFIGHPTGFFSFSSPQRGARAVGMCVVVQV